MTQALNRRRKYETNEEKDELDEVYRRLNEQSARISELEALIGKREHYSGYIEPEWQNGFAQVDPPLEPFGYRIVDRRFPVFKGHIDVSGASSEDVAFEVRLGKHTNGDPILLPYTVRDHIVLTDDGGSSFIMGLAILDADTLEFTLIWPAS